MSDKKNEKLNNQPVTNKEIDEKDLEGILGGGNPLKNTERITTHRGNPERISDLDD